jgi:hypothetical protein
MNMGGKLGSNNHHIIYFIRNIGNIGLTNICKLGEQSEKRFRGLIDWMVEADSDMALSG